jgi:hypothetical protein
MTSISYNIVEGIFFLEANVAYSALEGTSEGTESVGRGGVFWAISCDWRSCLMSVFCAYEETLNV